MLLNKTYKFEIQPVNKNVKYHKWEYERISIWQHDLKVGRSIK